MRLLNTTTLRLEEFSDSDTPPYAILSHTWSNSEISFLSMQNPDSSIRSKASFKKLEKFCALARDHGFEYGWADTCCIDKRNSAELSEAINSMYGYYYKSKECLIYLEDVPPSTLETRDEILDAFKNSRWFTRGWTLQELIASKTRYFFASDWSPIENEAYLNSVIAYVTRIDEQVLVNRDMLPNFCVAERLCWASRRKTTRSEDIAYSLMGLFNVNMPVIYGEGVSKAFRRLQHEIMQTSFDQTIFAWQAEHESSGLLAASPADFYETPQLGLWHPTSLSSFVMTNVGLSIRLNIIKRSGDAEVGRHTLPDAQGQKSYLAALQCDVKVGTSWKIFMVYLQPIGGANFFVNGESRKAYRRVRCAEWVPLANEDLVGWPYEDVLVLQDEHYELLMRSIKDNMERWMSRRGLGT